MSYSGYKHQKAEKVIAIIDNNGSVLAPVPVAPVNETAMVLLPQSLKALTQVAKQVGLDLKTRTSTSMAALIPPAIGSACSMRG